MTASADRPRKPDHLHARILPRAVAVALVRRGASYADAAREVAFTREAVREWSDDRPGLLRPQRIGKARALHDDQIQELDDLLETADTWRMNAIEAVLAKRFDVTLSLHAIMALLRSLGYETEHWLWFRTPKRVPFRDQREAARQKSEAATLERVAAITAHMHASGFSVGEIVGLLEECGAKGPRGRPLVRADVTATLAKRASRPAR
jgi:transposase